MEKNQPHVTPDHIEVRGAAVHNRKEVDGDSPP